MKIQLQNARLAFPKLFKAEQVNGEGKPAFSCAFLLHADDPQVDAINDMIEKLAEEKWEKKFKPILAAIRGKDHVCLHNGDTKADLEGYAGNWFINARAYTKPLILDRDARTILTEDSGRPYGGCYVNASIELWAQDNQWGKRINATLRGVQYRRDGDAFAGGAPATMDEFSDLSEQGETDLA